MLESEFHTLQPCLRLEYHPLRLSPKVPLLELVGSLGNGAYEEALRPLRMCPGRKQWHLFCSLATERAASYAMCSLLSPADTTDLKASTLYQLTLLKF